MDAIRKQDFSKTGCEKEMIDCCVVVVCVDCMLLVVVVVVVVLLFFGGNVKHKKNEHFSLL